MATPTFNSTELTSEAERDLPGSIDVRFYMETIPATDGQFAQPHGTGGRNITVQGILKSSNQATAALAMAALKTSLRTNQDLADGSTVATFVGTDANSYTNCILMSYETAGPIQISKAGSYYVARVAITATVRHLTP